MVTACSVSVYLSCWVACLQDWLECRDWLSSLTLKGHCAGVEGATTYSFRSLRYLLAWEGAWVMSFQKISRSLVRYESWNSNCVHRRIDQQFCVIWNWLREPGCAWSHHFLTGRNSHCTKAAAERLVQSLKLKFCAAPLAKRYLWPIELVIVYEKLISASKYCFGGL